MRYGYFAELHFSFSSKDKTQMKTNSDTIRQAIETIRESIATLDGLREWITSRTACDALFQESRDLGKVANDLERRVKECESNEASKRALSEAVAAIYFADDSDYLQALWNVVKLLGGNEAADLLEQDESAAYKKYQYPPMEEL